LLKAPSCDNHSHELRTRALFLKMRDLSKNTFFSKALMCLLAPMLAFSLLSCLRQPSEDVIKTQIVGTFADIAAVHEIVQIGEFDEKRQCWPVKARVIYGYTFGHKSEKVFEYCFHKNNEGHWIVQREIQVTLHWQDSSSNELGFKIERRIEPGGSYHEIATVGPNVTSYTDTGLTEGATYYYQVRSYNASGHSPYCPEIHIEASSD
jgi:hypothetical protein